MVIIYCVLSLWAVASRPFLLSAVSTTLRFQQPYKLDPLYGITSPIQILQGEIDSGWSSCYLLGNSPLACCWLHQAYRQPCVSENLLSQILYSG
jgi:hypothetical protein